MALSKIEADSLDIGQVGGRRNLIINGAMQVAQRGTSVTGVTANGYQTLDRWRLIASGATFDSSQQTLTLGQSDIPSQFKYFQRFNVTSGGDNSGPQTRIEDVNRFDGTEVTLSFYAKGTNPGGGHITVLFDQVFGSGGSTTVSLSEDVTLTSSWQRFTITKTLGSLSGKTVGTSSYLNIKFNQPSDDNTTDAWSIDFTGVQLEYGSVATPFEHRSYAEEYLACTRYCFQVTGEGSGGFVGVGHASRAGSSTSGLCVTSLPTPMRAKPTVSIGTNVFADYGSSSTTLTATSTVYASANNTPTVWWKFTHSAVSESGGTGGVLYTNDASASFVRFDAEL